MRLPAVLLSFFLESLTISSFASNSPPANLISLSNNNLTLTNIFDPECVKITEPPMVGLNPTMCHVVLQIICNRLTGPPPERLVRDKWIWTELVGCSLGYYLPEGTIVPYLHQCQNRVLQILELCSTNSRFNAGGINVQEMPDFSGDGQAFVAGAMRYAMAPERLTLPS